MSDKSRWTRRLELAAIVVVLGCLASSESLVDVPLCLNRCLGFRCPTCGTARSLWHLLHSNFAEAWAMNPIGYVALVVLVRRTVVLVRPRFPKLRLLENRWLDAGLLVSYLTLGSLRLMRVL
jgi:hypothetical protein